MHVIYFGPYQGKRKIQNKIIEEYEKLDDKSIIKKIITKPVENLKHPDIDYHAWVKVKLNGKWYNADPTFDANYIRNGLQPTHALKTDKECEKEKKLYNPGPKCDTTFSKKDINRIFSRNNIYIGNLKIPNTKDIKGFFKEIVYEFKYLNYSIKRSFDGFKEKIFSRFKRTKALPEGRDNTSNSVYDNFYNEFEQECGYTIQELLNMGCSSGELKYFMQKYDGKTGERNDRKKRVNDWIQKNSSRNAYKKFENKLHPDIGEKSPNINQTNSLSLTLDGKESSPRMER